ncbi:MAG TPA: GNAT family N-acetyltransferase [Casimicrobiaceae bacterium]|nr:GNAT family N-acetyltransferase [Casimicrobiaceae bacterium]
MRRLVPHDAAAYRALRLRALHEHPDAFTSDYAEEARKPVDALASRLAPDDHANERMFGAFVDGALVGTVGLIREARLKNRHKATLVGMYVTTEATGQGIGRRLLVAVLEDARRQRGITRVVLTVTQGNHAARELYARAGFQTFGVEPCAIRVGEAWFAKEHMGLTLSEPGAPPDAASPGAV